MLRYISFCMQKVLYFFLMLYSHVGYSQSCELCVWMPTKHSCYMTQILVFFPLIISLYIYPYIGCEGESPNRPTQFESAKAKPMEKM